MTKKEQLLAWELENKQLDVEIKQEQLEKARFQTQTIRRDIEIQALAKYRSELTETVRYQNGQLFRLRFYLKEAQQNLRYRAEETALRQRVQKELDDLKNTPAVRLVLWFRKLVTPIKQKMGFRPAFFGGTKEPANISQCPDILSPEVARMSADEFKKKYIDSIVLVDPAAL